MKNLHITITFLLAAILTCSSAFAQTTQPADTVIGVLTFNSSYLQGHRIKFLNADGTIWFEFSRHSKEHGSWPSDFEPYNYNSLYQRLSIRVLSLKGDRYEVIANEETGLRKFVVVAKNPGVSLVTMQQYILGNTIDYYLNNNPLRDTINGQPLEVSRGGGTAKNLVIKGDWLQMEYFDTVRKQRVKGWIRWRENGRLLVMIAPDF